MPEDRRVLDRPAPGPDRVWAFGPGPEQVADIYAPPEGLDRGAPVLLVHGGYWRPEYDRTHLRPMASALAAAGHLVALVEYARIPGQPDAAVADVALALSCARDALGGRPPVLVGHSAGGQLALVAAGGSGARACLALAPVADLALADALHLDDDAVRAFLGGPAAQRPDLDPSRRPSLPIPVSVVHGEADSLVPLAVSSSYCAATGARLVTLPDTGHFELIDPTSRAWDLVIAELTALAAASGIE